MTNGSVAFLASLPELVLRQRVEVAEAFGLETANSYDLFLPNGGQLRAAERPGGFWDGFGRQLGGHTASAFVVDVFDAHQRVILTIHHPARFIQQEVTVFTGSGRPLGAIKQAFTLFDKELSVSLAQRPEAFTMNAGMFSWDMPIMASSQAAEAARITKHWSGAGRELFTDADSFRLVFAPWLDADARAMMVATALFVDLVFFERRAGR
jgi:hypothetical protein